MKKTLLTLLLAASLPAFAQTAVTVPTAPVVPATATVSPNATAALNIASTNRVFIDQSGDNVNVNVTQEGTGNKQGSTTRPVYLRGIDQKLVTRQIGNSNEIMLEAVNASTGSGQGVTITIQQIGDNNKVDAACGYGSASTGSPTLTGCKAADLNWKFTGDSNELQFRGSGEDLKSAITVTGSLNKLFIDAIGNRHSQTLMISGDSNEFNINQRSAGAEGSSIWVELTGTGNRFNVSQTGTVDNVLNIKSVGNNGTWNIVQKN